jgi:hypothetical protein
MLEAKPSEPTMRMSFGFETVGGSTKRVIASRIIERHNAIRKTALKKAPRISARNHCVCVSYDAIRIDAWQALTPKEYLSELVFWAALTAHNPTINDIMSFNY